MVVLKVSGGLAAVALGAGVLVAAPAAAATGAGAAFGVGPSAGAVAAATCVGVAPTYADVLVRAAWTETINHPAAWVTQARYTRWVVDQEFRPAVPEVSHVETDWSVEPLVGWTATGESRPVLVRPGTPAVPEVAEVTELRLVDPGQPYLPPTIETIRHEAVIEYEFRQLHGSAVHWDTDSNWNAQGNPASIGFEATGASRVLKGEWDEDVVIDPGQAYIPPTYETIVVVPYQPALPAVPNEWGAELEYTRRVVTQEAVPAVPGSGHLEAQWSAAPPGDGWEATGETREVEVQAAWTEEVHHPAVYEKRLIKPGVVCPVPDSGGDTGGVGGDSGGSGGDTGGSGGDSGEPGAVPGGAGGAAGGRPGTAVTVPASSHTPNSPATAGHSAATASSASAAAATLPTTGASEGLLTVAGVAVAMGAALLAFRAWATRIAEGSGRHRSGLARGEIAAITGGLVRWRPFRRRAHRRTA